MANGQQDNEKKEEQIRVDRVVKEITRKINYLSENVKDLKESVIDIRREFWEDVTVNLEELDDFYETEASIKQQAEFLSERERSHGQFSERIDTLKRLQDTPYFGRIDFKEDDEKEEMPIYIGLASVMDEDEEDFLIYDWRAPISSMYYDFPPGPANYDTMEGNISGEILLKRQYMIRNGELKGMFDTGLTIGDSLLQAVLGNQASTKMKSIVATIQREQNQIIRNEKSKLLVVQGVAGSGKTSAALQRVAYLLYRYRETLTSEQIVLFSPNPLFNSYVATVLPELGEDNMQQMTFYQYLNRQLPKSIALESPFEQMEYYLNGEGETFKIRKEAMHIKASLAFKAFIDDYLDQLGEAGIIFRNVTFRGKAIVKKEEIAHYFYNLEDHISLADRVEETMEWITKRVRSFEKKEVGADWLRDEIELLDKEDFLDVHQRLEDKQPFEEDSFNDYTKEEELLRKKVLTRKLRPLKTKIKRKAFVDRLKTYRQLFENTTFQRKTEDLGEFWQDISDLTAQSLKNKKLTWEDATPYVYFEKALIGFNDVRTIKHVFIDEAQDYSPFQFAFIKKLFPVSRMTLLGDINQAIYAHALHEESLLSEKLEEKHERVELTRSYRSTEPIVSFTKSFMPNGHLIEPFERDGSLPVVMEVEDIKMVEEKTLDFIEMYQEAGHQTIAVIAKTLAESKELYALLKDRVDAELMTQETQNFGKGIAIIPAYLAKGIEFDAVIIPNASNENYQNALERNLFYTACTRAQHELVLLSIGEPSAFIQDVPTKHYKHYKVHAIFKNSR